MSVKIVKVAYFLAEKNSSRASIDEPHTKDEYNCHSPLKITWLLSGVCGVPLC